MTDSDLKKTSVAAENIFLEMNNELNAMLKHYAGRDGLQKGRRAIQK